jgi:nucleoside-diphosphate-sugar epimerase
LNIFITGYSGFVGKAITKKFKNYFNFIPFDRNESIHINEDIVLHLAGKAHDLKKTTAIADYYEVNTELTKKIFTEFLKSNATVFITLSSVKAVADEFEGFLTEDCIPNPITHYGKSKLLAEEFILSKIVPQCKRVYILRPSMIHGAGNKGNLNLLFKIVSKGIPWPLGKYENKRSFCSIDNLCFIIKELIENEHIPSGVYNIADDMPLSTKEVINLISESQGKTAFIWNIPKFLIILFARLGDFLNLPLNTERLVKLTETYIVSNNKIITAINKQLPLSSKDGLMRTFKSFKL